MTKIIKSRACDLSIVIGALNEEKRIGDTLDKLSDYINRTSTFKKLRTEVVVVIPDGTDNTEKVVRSKKAKFAKLRILKPGKILGKGRDIKYGVDRSVGDTVLYMDADMATPPRYIEKFYKLIDSGEDLVVATRNIKKHHKNPMRLLISNIGNVLFKLASGVWIEDSQCGFKMFSKNAAKICFERMTIVGWGFDMELLAIARINRINIRTVRVNDWKNVEGGTFERSNIINNIFSSITELMTISKNKYFSSKYKEAA
jgi:glycosyltransferase involved in cell wall biosynthesis